MKLKNKLLNATLQGLLWEIIITCNDHNILVISSFWTDIELKVLKLLLCWQKKTEQQSKDSNKVSSEKSEQSKQQKIWSIDLRRKSGKAT